MIKRLFFVIFVILSLFSCSKYSAYKNAIGRKDTVIIISSDYTWGLLEDKLTYALQDTFRFPSREENFEIDWVGYDKTNLHILEKNVLFVVPYYQDKKGKEIIDNILSRKDIESSLSNGPKLFEIEDAWTKGQDVLIILGDSLSNISSFVDSLGKKLYWKYYRSVIKREKYFSFYTGHNKGDEEKLLKKYGYKLPIPSDFSIVEEKGEVVRLIAHFPDRLILITPLKDTLLPDLSRGVFLRDSFASIFYEGDRVVRLKEYAPVLKEPVFKDSLHPAVVLEGLWETADTNKIMYGGGPFFTYFKQFGNKIYMIDCSVWSPGKKKFPSLLTLRYMAENFSVIKEEKNE